MTTTVLGRRALSRATLARQRLLERVPGSALELVGHLVGLQAQAPLAPYVGLWTRLAAFDPGEIGAALDRRTAVRAALWRGTLHLVTVGDYLAIQPLTRPVLAAGFATNWRRRLPGVDVDAVVAIGRELLTAQTLPRSRLGALLAERWPGADAEALAYAASYLLPVVQPPPRGVWGRTGPAAFVTAEAWLGAGPDPGPAGPPDAFVARYLAAFGPATAADTQTWSGLTGLREVLERLPGLRRFRDEAGRELWDTSCGPLPDPDTPAPVRYLPEYDNVLFSYADRTRLNPDAHPLPLLAGNGARAGTVLVDGAYAADWALAAGPVLTVTPLRRLTAAERADVTAEGDRLLRFLRGPGDVRVSDPGRGPR